MRVISGLRKGHKLKSPKGKEVRPTEDRIKESLFNILSPLKEECLVLDLFAGTGSIGIEFLSRGAKKVYFIDSSNASIKIIKENLSSTNFIENANVNKVDSIKSIKLLKEKKVEFDYIFIDPPYEKHDLFLKVIDSLNKHLILKKDGIIIIEHEKTLNLDNNLDNFKIIDCRNYGSKSLSFLIFNYKEEFYEGDLSR